MDRSGMSRLILAIVALMLVLVALVYRSTGTVTIAHSDASSPSRQ